MTDMSNLPESEKCMVVNGKITRVLVSQLSLGWGCVVFLRVGKQLPCKKGGVKWIYFSLG